MYVCMLDKKKRKKNKCPGLKPGEILNLSLIGLITTEIYYRTGITGNTDTHTDC